MIGASRNRERNPKELFSTQTIFKSLKFPDFMPQMSLDMMLEQVKKPDGGSLIAKEVVESTPAKK